MRNNESLEIKKSEATEKLIRMSAGTRKKVKEFLNESSIFGNWYPEESGQPSG